jgi:hemolysin activation/secretion protein
MLAGACRALLMVAVVGASTAAIAQTIPPSEQPGRERERFEDRAPPRAQPRGTPISLPSTVAPPDADSISIIIRSVRVEGSTIYTEQEFAELYRELLGRVVTLKAVYDIAQRITAKYGNDGYVLTRAIVPPQQFHPRGAVVRIQIIEGYVDKVEWPAELSKYPDYFSYYSERITAERPVNVRTIERYLLLAADLPGLKFKNSLKPSATKQGAATLVVEVERKSHEVLARLDNRGTEARGPYQYLGSLTVNNLLRTHESFNISYASTFENNELQYFAGRYRRVVNPEGLTIFLNASHGYGRPGTELLELLNYNTKSTVVEAGFSYPFIRLRERNLAFSALGFMSNDDSDLLDTTNSRDRLRGVRARIDGDAADPYKGINQWSLAYSQGFKGLGSTGNDNPFSSRANGQVDFSKLEASYSRLQALHYGFSFLAAVYAQHAFDPLLSSELCGYGGRVFGRAYDPSEILGDSCVQVLGELRLDLPLTTKQLTQMQVYTYVDRGWLHNIAPVFGTPENIEAASIGAGMRLGWLDYFTADLSAARAIDGPRDGVWRYFFVLTARY